MSILGDMGNALKDRLNQASGDVNALREELTSQGSPAMDWEYRQLLGNLVQTQETIPEGNYSWRAITNGNDLYSSDGIGSVVIKYPDANDGKYVYLKRNQEGILFSYVAPDGHTIVVDGDEGYPDPLYTSTNPDKTYIAYIKLLSSQKQDTLFNFGALQNRANEVIEAVDMQPGYLLLNGFEENTLTADPFDPDANTSPSLDGKYFKEDYLIHDKPVYKREDGEFYIHWAKQKTRAFTGSDFIVPAQDFSAWTITRKRILEGRFAYGGVNYFKNKAGLLVPIEFPSIKYCNNETLTYYDDAGNPIEVTSEWNYDSRTGTCVWAGQTNPWVKPSNWSGNESFPEDAEAYLSQIQANNTFTDIVGPETTTENGFFYYQFSDEPTAEDLQWLSIDFDPATQRGYSMTITPVLPVSTEVNTIQESITTLKGRVDTLEAINNQGTPVHTKDALPIIDANARQALVTDGTTTNSPCMAYYYDGAWHRTFDNSVLQDQELEIYLLAGQSNAHGHAIVSDLPEADKNIHGAFYHSWNSNTQDASTTQIFATSWKNVLEAGETRGGNFDSMFGPELGFVKQAEQISLNTGKPVGILKYAIGATSLTDVGGDPDYSDWDLTATGPNAGDALRAFKLAIADGLTKIGDTDARFKLAGMLWWQGESNGVNWNKIRSDKRAFFDHMRTWLHDEGYITGDKTHFPIVMAGTDSYWGLNHEQIANEDPYLGYVNTQDLASPAGADRTLLHPGSDETYQASQSDVDAGIASFVGQEIGSPDFNGDGINDMMAIGMAFADQMALAKAGNAGHDWTPSQITTQAWFDFDDETTHDLDTEGKLLAIEDKSGNLYALTKEVVSNDIVISSHQNYKIYADLDNNQDTLRGNLSFSSNTKQRWYLVCKINGVNSPIDSLIAVSGNVSGSTEQFILQARDPGLFQGEWYVHADSNFINVPYAQGGLQGWNILEVEWDEPNNRMSSWLNGNAIATNEFQSGALGPAMLVKLGSYIEFTECSIGEFLVVDNPSSANVEKIQGYLAHKWGLESELPSAHTYKTNQPNV